MTEAQGTPGHSFRRPLLEPESAPRAASWLFSAFADDPRPILRAACAHSVLDGCLTSSSYVQAWFGVRLGSALFQGVTSQVRPAQTEGHRHLHCQPQPSSEVGVPPPAKITASSASPTPSSPSVSLVLERAMTNPPGPEPVDHATLASSGSARSLANPPVGKHEFPMSLSAPRFRQ